MRALLELIRDRAQNLTAAMQFARRNPKELATIDYFLNVMPARETDDLAPFCLISPGKGGRNEKRRRQAELTFCLWQEDRDQALTDLSILEDAVALLAHPGQWHPWVLASHEDFYGVDKDSGVQAHPQYYYTVLLQFMTNETLKHTPWRG